MTRTDVSEPNDNRQGPARSPPPLLVPRVPPRALWSVDMVINGLLDGDNNDNSTGNAHSRSASAPPEGVGKAGGGPGERRTAHLSDDNDGGIAGIAVKQLRLDGLLAQVNIVDVDQKLEQPLAGSAAASDDHEPTAPREPECRNAGTKTPCPAAIVEGLTACSVVPVISADSQPGPVLADDLLKLGGVLRQPRHIPDQHQIRQTGGDVGQDLPAPT